MEIGRFAFLRCP